MYSIEESRIHHLNSKGIKKGAYVLYWMQQAQRAKHNHALNYAIKLADSINLPVLVFFGIAVNYPQANLRHYSFMLEGLAEVIPALEKLGIKSAVWIVDPVEGVNKLSVKAAAIVSDFGYLRHQIEWRKAAAASVDCSFTAVETDVIIPVETASRKEEYAAATLRPKIRELIKFYIQIPPAIKPVRDSLDFNVSSADMRSPGIILKSLDIDKTVTPVRSICGGTSAGIKLLDKFIRTKIDGYAEKRSDPSQDYSSGLSPYLHFGQISPVYTASRIMDTESPGRDAFLEELIVRRELSMNFVYYNSRYDSIRSLPGWSLATLRKHQSDKREYVYSKPEFENSLTHDLCWNAAENELVTTGRIHNYMRMYWGKKIIEWTQTADEAFDLMIYLNNKYALDGRDPNSYSGIAWCFGKHDRPWKERDIFGTTRYMNEKGLNRKFDMSGYIKKFSGGIPG